MSDKQAKIRCLLMDAFAFHYAMLVMQRLIDIAKGQFDSTAYASSPLADAKRVFPYDEYRLFPRISGSCQFHNTFDRPI